jgi:hypothetical protein
MSFVDKLHAAAAGKAKDQDKLKEASKGKDRSFVDKLKSAAAEVAAQEVDPWRLPLGRLQGEIGIGDSLERITTQQALDAVGLAQSKRRRGFYQRLAKVMISLGWTPVRVRAPTRGGYLEQVRGYCRKPYSVDRG